MLLYIYPYKILKKINYIISKPFTKLYALLIFKGNGITFNDFQTSGIPYVVVSRGAYSFSIGKNFSMNNGIKGNPIGCYQRCTFFVAPKSRITIGDNVGISQAALISYCEIRIDDNVKIGGGTQIFTTDFHSLNSRIRASKEDTLHAQKAPVHIYRNVFIGANVMILKGVTIGENSIIGAGSVVTKSIPANEIWAGNPARFIKKISL